MGLNITSHIAHAQPGGILVSTSPPTLRRSLTAPSPKTYPAADPTTDILIPPDMQGNAHFVAKQNGVLAGLDVALAVCKRVDPTLQTHISLQDGAPLQPNAHIATITGRMNSILKAERTALNFIRRLSGVATQTAAYVSAVQGCPVRIVDTRKTTPGLRALEKYAVTMGGGHNHRQNLGDGILIKDNHIQALADSGMSLADVVRKANREKSHTINVEVEVEDMAQVEDALDAGATLILLDNMDAERMAMAVSRRARQSRNRGVRQHHPRQRPRRRRIGRGHHLNRRAHPLIRRP